MIRNIAKLFLVIIFCFKSMSAEILHDLVKAGDIDNIRLFLEFSNRGLNKLDENGQTPLHYAVCGDYDAIVKLLVEKGARCNKRGREAGRAPLHIAAELDDYEMANLLIDKGKAKINIKDNKGFTPLHYAAGYGSCKVVEQLLFRGANPRELNNYGNTPLHVAAYWGRSKAAKLLVEKSKAGIINVKNKKGRTPLCVAARAGNVDVVLTLLLNGADRNIKFWPIEKCKSRLKREKDEIIKELLTISKKELEKKVFDPIMAEEVHPIMMRDFGLSCGHKISLKTFERMLEFEEEPAGTAHPKLKSGESLENYPQVIINGKQYAEVVDSWWRIEKATEKVPYDHYYFIQMPKCPYDRKLYPKEYYADKVKYL